MVAAIFLAPLMVVVVIAVVAAEGDLSTAGVIAATGLLASAAIFGLARAMMALIHRSHGPRFAAFAAALGGQVARSLLGERLLRVPHPRGRVELDYRYFGGGPDEPGDAYTRVALVCEGGRLPAQRHRLPERTGQVRLHPAAQAELAALRAAFGAQARLHLEGRGRPPSVELWLPGWIADPEVARRTVELARPHLEALATGPWAA